MLKLLISRCARCSKTGAHSDHFLLHINTRRMQARLPPAFLPPGPCDRLRPELLRGVYYVPERSELLGAEVPASVDEVVRAVARANKWVVTSAGDAALNALGLDTQVPARHVYVSSGPYKTYSYGPHEIELRHRANRDLLGCSPATRTIVQALKALGRGGASDETLSALARNLTDEDAETFLEESRGLTSWVAEAAKRIWE